MGVDILGLLDITVLYQCVCQHPTASMEQVIIRVMQIQSTQVYLPLEQQ